MIVFPWLDKYNTNVEIIDNQHRKLVGLLNNLASAMSEGKGNKVMGQTLKELIDYSVYHFEEEEKYFDQVDYPHAEIHRKEHRLFIEKMNQIKADMEVNKMGLSVELMRFLKDWLIDHINDTDQKLGGLLIKAGIK